MFNRFLAILITFSCIFGSPAHVRAADSPKTTDFVDIQQIIPSVDLDIKYATTDNFTHTKLYQNPKALLRHGTAAKLKKVADEVEKKGYYLKIWDAYRSHEAQFTMWKLVPDTRYVANPYKVYSNHSRGSAVDLTLIDSQGNELPMPTGYDDFTVAAARAKDNVHAKYLQTVVIQILGIRIRKFFNKHLALRRVNLSGEHTRNHTLPTCVQL